MWVFHYSFTHAIIFWVFSISSTLLLHMVNTRNRVTANNAENNRENNNNNDANLQPPPLPTLNKCWLCKHKCFKPCSRPWSTCLLNLKHHLRRRGIGLEIFGALSCQHFLMLWSQWIMMIGLSHREEVASGTMQQS
jgi:hypothetical protein